MKERMIKIMREPVTTYGERAKYRLSDDVAI